MEKNIIRPTALQGKLANAEEELKKDSDTSITEMPVADYVFQLTF